MSVAKTMSERSQGCTKARTKIENGTESQRSSESHLSRKNYRNFKEHRGTGCFPVLDADVRTPAYIRRPQLAEFPARRTLQRRTSSPAEKTEYVFLFAAEMKTQSSLNRNSFRKERAFILSLYKERRIEILARLREFRHVDPDLFFYELAYCLLTPQSSARNAAQAVNRLIEQNFAETDFDPAPVLRSGQHYVRFHNAKAKYLRNMKRLFPEIHALLLHKKSRSAAEIRMWLVDNVKGLGMKEATHFLRNIGRNDGLAILDRHIMRELQKLGVVRHLPKSLTLKNYLVLENEFIRFSEEIGIPVDELDLLFWSLGAGEILK
jgi:N-glycosylase/DNA lyase